MYVCEIIGQVLKSGEFTIFVAYLSYSPTLAKLVIDTGISLIQLHKKAPSLSCCLH